MKIQWIVDQLSILGRIPDCARLDVRILGPKRNLDDIFFFSLGRHVNEFIEIFFFKRSSFKLRYETVTRIALCYSHQACCLLYQLREINNGIHIYQFTFDFYTSVSGCGCGYGLEQKFWRMDGFGESADLHTPIHPPPHCGLKKSPQPSLHAIS